MDNGVKIKQDHLKQLLANTRDLTFNKVLVGIPSTRAGRKAIEGEPDGPNNAVIGYIQEHGSPAQNIPPRPFLIPGIKAAQPEIVQRLEVAMNLTLRGQKDAALKSLHALGLFAQAAVRKKITDGPFLALAKRTIAARRARKIYRTKPLMDTGQLRNSIGYVIRGRWEKTNGTD